VAVTTTAGRRSALGVNAMVQIALATVLLIGINVWSAGLTLDLFGYTLEVPGHYARIDLTRGEHFTLPDDVVKQFHQLKGETTIVVYERHRTFGTLSDKSDRYDAAAERKVVEKIKDLVEQLRELGPRFRVEVLDSEEERYDEKLTKLTKQAPALRQAIETAPENSLFFYSDGQVQQLSFNAFLRLDKDASARDNNSAGNLVLDVGGVKPIANRIFHLEQRRPRVGVLVVHEALTTKGSVDVFTLSALRKSLEANGFDVTDVVMKKWKPGGDREPSVDQPEDSKLLRLRDQLEVLDEQVTRLEGWVKMLSDLVASMPTAPLDKLNTQLTAYLRKYEPFLANARIVDEEDREVALPAFKQRLALRQNMLQDSKQQRDDTEKELSTINADQVGERERVKDVRAKMVRTLAECDLLIIPRLTLLQSGDDVVGEPLHDLDGRQVSALKDYLKAGKPILAAFGPENHVGQPAGLPDELEKLLRELGVQFGKRTVLYEAETRSFGGRSLSRFLEDKIPQVPAFDLEQPASKLLAFRYLKPSEAPQEQRRVNPIRESLHVMARCSGTPLAVRWRFTRPVYLEPRVANTQKFEPEILVSSPASWNDDQPFSTRTRPVPRFEPPSLDDPDNKTPDEKRQGPFTIGVAFQTDVPKSWLASESDTPPSVRVVALGHGGAFVGKELSPASERLLLDSCNWLLGREDRLAHEEPEWKYPRVALNERDAGLWMWSARLGLPLVFAYLGVVVLLVRRLR
jgi:hypothetical protein